MKNYLTRKDFRVKDLKPFEVTIIREAGRSPITGEFLDKEDEKLQIMAANKQDAYVKAMFLSKIRFSGQHRRTFIDGIEHFDEES